MNSFLPFRVSASGLMVQRLRMNLIASNIANADTTRTPGGGPYRRKDLLVMAAPLDQREGFSGILNDYSSSISGVVPIAIVNDPKPFRRVYDPGHPDADKNGYVTLPNISPIEEMINMISAVRAYEANVTVINNTKNMISKALEI